MSVSADKLHVGDIGRIIQVTATDRSDPTGETTISIPASATVTLKLKKPDATVVDKSATVVSGAAQYTTVSGDLDQAGTWYAQPFVEQVDGVDWYGDKAPFTVLPNLS